MARTYQGSTRVLPILRALPEGKPSESTESTPHAIANNRRTIRASRHRHCWSTQEDKERPQVHSNGNGLCHTLSGSNFMSELLHNIMELLQIHQLKTSPYHPQTDGMLERFHGTLKGMMRKTCRERKEWDEYLPYVCFAYRDSIHSSTHSNSSLEEM